MVAWALSLITLAFQASGHDGSEDWDPWQFTQVAAVETGAPPLHALSPQSAFLSSLFWVYRNVISPVNGSNCPMYPSCSRFSLEAISELNPVEGFLATMDRLHRCGHDLHFYDLVLLDDKWLRYDPPGSIEGIGQ